MKKILVLLLAGIGDTLLATPMLALLKKTYPDASLSVLVREKPSKTILERNKDIDHVHYFPFLKAGYIRSLLYILRLRKRNYDLSILAFPTNRFQTNLISFLIGAKQRLAHAYDAKKLVSLGFLNTKRLPLDKKRHTLDENLALLGLLGISSKKVPRKILLPLTKQEEFLAEKYLKLKKIKKNDFVVGIHAGSSIMAGMWKKRWPKEKFVQLADLLAKKKKAKIFLFGGPPEEEHNKSIKSSMHHKAFLADVSLPLLSSLALVKRCDLFIANDALFMHIASFHTVPTVALSGHLVADKTKPLHKKSRYLTPEESCSLYRVGEDLTCKYAGTPDYCPNKISIEQAYAAIEEVLK